MAYDKVTLRKIYDRTSGYCHICRKKLSLKNYNRKGEKGAWEVDHSRPHSKGGSDHLNNLYASCMSCNRKKSTFTSKTARSWNNRRKAPLSKIQRKKAKRSNAIVGGVIGYGIIGFVGGPVGALVGAAIGGKIGYAVDPDK